MSDDLKIKVTVDTSQTKAPLNRLNKDLKSTGASSGELDKNIRDVVSQCKGFRISDAFNPTSLKSFLGSLTNIKSTLKGITGSNKVTLTTSGYQEIVRLKQEMYSAASASDAAGNSVDALNTALNLKNTTKINSLTKGMSVFDKMALEAATDFEAMQNEITASIAKAGEFKMPEFVSTPGNSEKMAKRLKDNFETAKKEVSKIGETDFGEVAIQMDNAKIPKTVQGYKNFFKREIEGLREELSLDIPVNMESLPLDMFKGRAIEQYIGALEEFDKLGDIDLTKLEKEFGSVEAAAMGYATRLQSEFMDKGIPIEFIPNMQETGAKFMMGTIGKRTGQEFTKACEAEFKKLNLKDLRKMANEWGTDLKGAVGKVTAGIASDMTKMGIPSSVLSQIDQMGIGFSAATTNVKGLNTALKITGSTMSTLIVAVGALVAAFALVKNAINVASVGDQIQDDRKKVYMSAEAYQRWGYVLQQNGIQIKSLSTVMRSFAGKVASGDSALKKYGITATSVEGAFGQAVTTIQNMRTESEKVTAATELFGKRASELMPVLTGDAQGTQALMNAYDALGATMSEDMINRCDSLTDSILELKMSFKGLGNTLAGPLLGFLKTIVNWLTVAVAAVNIFLKAIGTAIGGLFGKNKNTDKLKTDTSSIKDSLGNVADSTGTTADNLKDAKDTAKELKRTLIGIDELNTLPSSSDAGSSGSSGTTGSGLDIGDYDLSSFDGISEGIAEKIGKVAEFINKYKGVLMIGIGVLMALIGLLTYNIPLAAAGIALAGLGIKVSIQNGEWGRIFDNLKAAIQKFIDWFKGTKLGEYLTSIFDLIKTVFGAIADWFKNSTLGQIIINVFKGIGTKISNIFKGVKKIIKGFIDWMKNFSFKDLFKGIWEGITTAFDKCTTTVQEFILFVLKIPDKIKGIPDKIKHVPEKIKGFFKNCGEFIVGVFAGLAKSLNLDDLGGKASATVESIKAAFETIKTSFSIVVDSIKEKWGGLVDKVGDIKANFSMDISEKAQAIMDFFTNAKEKLKVAVSAVWNGSGKVSEKIEQLKEWGKGLKIKVSAAWLNAKDNISEKISQLKTWAKDKIVVKVKALWDNTSDAIKEKIDALSDLKDTISVKVKAIWDKTSDNVKDKIEALSKLKDSISIKIKAAWSGSTKNISENIDKIQELGKKAKSYVFNFKAKVTESKAFEKFKDAVDGIKNAEVIAKIKAKFTSEDGSNAWEELVANVKDVTANVIVKITTTWSELKDKWESLTGHFKDLTKSVKLKIPTWNSLKTAWQNLKANFTNITVGIKLKFSAAIDNVKNWINTNVINKINSNLPKIFPKIPKLAKGGVLTNPTLALMGEYPGANSNPEIVTPQNIMYETVVKANGELANAFAQGCAQIIKAINEQDNTVTLDGKVLAKSVANANNAYRRSTGMSLI